jgi:hypothetical protein
MNVYNSLQTSENIVSVWHRACEISQVKKSAFNELRSIQVE